MKWTPWIPAALFAVSALAIGIDSLASSAPSAELSKRESLVLGLVCAHCHSQPGIGVPLIGDEAEWKRRREQGFEALVANTINGAGNMPPLGTCSFCSEEELRRLVAFVAGFPLETVGNTAPDAAR